MSAPMTEDEWRLALRKSGAAYRLQSRWTTHNRNHRGPFQDVRGVMIHHTAGRGSLDLVTVGTRQLPGPLAHAHLGKDGTVVMVSHGRANHAGSGGRNAFDAVVGENSVHPVPGPDEIDGNSHFYGIEIENLGDGKDPYPEVQYKAAVRWAAAICRHHGWTEHSVIGHGEWTRRKVDPSFSMKEFRLAVARELKPPAPGPVEPKRPEAYRDVVETDAIPSPSWDADNPFWTMETYFRHLAETQAEILKRLKELEGPAR
jgi:N-acetylmuramoyl-L-alanine amidase